MGTDHGTGGIRAGLYGPLVVRRKGDVLPDKQFTVVFNDMTINNRKAHEAPDFMAELGEMYHCHVQSHADMGMAGVFHVTGGNMRH